MTKSEKPTGDVPNTVNSDDHVYEYFAAKQREYVEQVLDDDLIEEYRRQPLGRHSEPLERTLAYFRRLPMDQLYALKKEGDGTYRMISMSGRRGARPVYANDEVYQTLQDGYFGIFMRHIQDMTEK